MSDAPRLRALFRAHITASGQLIIDEPHRWRGWLAKHRGKAVTISAEPQRKPRSLQANKYLWGVVYPCLAEWSGYDVEEIHELMKQMFVPPKTITLPSGRRGRIPSSTAALDSAEFTTYVDKVIRFAAEQGVIVPAPNEAVEIVA